MYVRDITARIITARTSDLFKKTQENAQQRERERERRETGYGALSSDKRSTAEAARSCKRGRKFQPRKMSLMIRLRL